MTHISVIAKSNLSWPPSPPSPPPPELVLVRPVKMHVTHTVTHTICLRFVVSRPIGASVMISEPELARNKSMTHTIFIAKAKLAAPNSQ